MYQWNPGADVMDLICPKTTDLVAETNIRRTSISAEDIQVKNEIFSALKHVV